jgi:hypothetical protein
MTLIRIPYTYTSPAAEPPAGTVQIEDNEFFQLLSGQKSDISETVKVRIRKALSNSGSKINLFLAAYAQKGMNRIVQVMEMADNVQRELNVPWRVHAMTTGGLSDFLDELNTERHRTVQELMGISEKFKEGGGEGDLRDVLGAAPEKVEGESTILSRRQKKNIVSFYKRKIAGNA